MTPLRNKQGRFVSRLEATYGDLTEPAVQSAIRDMSPVRTEREKFNLYYTIWLVGTAVAVVVTYIAKA